MRNSVKSIRTKKDTAKKKKKNLELNQNSGDKNQDRHACPKMKIQFKDIRLETTIPVRIGTLTCFTNIFAQG